MIAKSIIIVLNWNGWKDTIECLESLCLLEHLNFAVVVVDNASTDSSREKLLEWGARSNHALSFAGLVNEKGIEKHQHQLNCLEWIYVQSERNGGFAAGNNLGIRFALQADCQYVWLLNNDTVVDKNALTALEKRMEYDQKIGMCGSILRYYDERSTVQAVGGVSFNFMLGRGTPIGQGLQADDLVIDEMAKAPPTFVTGASLFVSTTFLRDVGLLEESYFLYYEEIDWAVRASPKWITATAADSIVYHKEGASIGSQSLGRRPSSSAQYYLNRNLIRFYALRRPWLLPIALLRIWREIFNLLIKKDLQLALITFKAFIDGILMRSGPKAV